jgi:hypothetical protein
MTPSRVNAEKRTVKGDSVSPHIRSLEVSYDDARIVVEA